MTNLAIHKPNPLSTALSRAWLMLSANYRALSGSIVAVLLVGLAYLAWITGWQVCAAALVGVVIGIYLACIDIEFFSNRTIAILGASDENSPAPSTGLSPLDNIINASSIKLEGTQAQVAALEERCASLEEKYQLLTNNLAAAIIIRNPESKITYCSPFTEVLSGYSIHEIYQADEDFFLDVVHEDDLEKYKRALKVCAAGEAFQVRYRLYHKSGIEMWVETRTVPVLDDDGAVAFSLSITLDVTGTVRYQRQVEEKNRDLRDFTYMVSHDLKAPIFTIKGMLGVIREDYGSKITSNITEVIGHIENATKRLESLVTGVLEFSRISSEDIKFIPVSLPTIIHEIEQDFSTQLGQAGIHFTVAEQLPIVMGDKVRVYQIFSNLVGNALKYRDSDRPLEVKIEPVAQSNPRLTTICVRDNGLGIPTDKLSDVFRPFHRAHKNSIEGSGIGLATVKRILEKLGGEIRLESTPNEGSAFYVTLRKGS